VRYLKRWNDVAIPSESDRKPIGLAVVLLAIERLQPTWFVGGKPNDLGALSAVVSQVVGFGYRLVVRKPTPEFEDLLGRLSDEEMTALKKRFAALAEALEKAEREADPVNACNALRAVFGKDFPVPEPEDTARKTAAPAIITSSSSA